MDQWTAFVALTHLKLRIEILQRNPSRLQTLLKETHMATVPVIPAPIQLAGLKSRLARGTNLEKRAGVIGPRIDAAHEVIENGIQALENYAPGLEQYGGDLMDQIKRLSEPSNGGPPLEEEAVPPTIPPTVPPEQPKGPNGGPRIL